MKRYRWTLQLLLLCGALTPPVLLLFYVGATLVTPEYSHLSETVSQLGVTGRPHPEIINIGFIIGGLLANSFAYGLNKLLGNQKGPKAACILLMVCGTCILISGIIHVDAKESEALTVGGILHIIFILIAIFAFVLSILVFAKVVSSRAEWYGWAQFSVITAILLILLTIPSTLTIFEKIEGALERAVIILVLVWLEAVSIKSLRTLSSQVPSKLS